MIYSAAGSWRFSVLWNPKRRQKEFPSRLAASGIQNLRPAARGSISNPANSIRSAENLSGP